MPNKNWLHHPAVQIGLRALGFFATFLSLLLAIAVMFGAFGILATSDNLQTVFYLIPQETRQTQGTGETPGFDFWNRQFTSQEPIDRHVVYEISRQEVKITLRLSLDKTEKLAEQLLSNQPMVETPGLILAAFGSLHAYGEDSLRMDWSNPTWSLDSKTQRLSMSLEAVVSIDERETRMILVNWIPSSGLQTVVHDELKVVLQESNLRFAGLVPESLSEDQAIFKSEGKPLSPVSVEVELAGAGDSPAPALTRQIFINKLGDISVPFLSRLLYALVELAPLIAMILVGLGIVKSQVQPPHPLIRLTILMLWFHFVLYYALANMDLLRLIMDPLRSLILRTVGAYLPTNVSVFWRNSVSDSYDLVVVALFGILLPLVYLRSMQSDADDHLGQNETSRKSLTVRWREWSNSFISTFRTRWWHWVTLFVLNLLPLAGLVAGGIYLWLVYDGQIDLLDCASAFRGQVSTAWNNHLPFGEQISIWISYALTCLLPRWVPLVLALSGTIFLVRWLVPYLARTLWKKQPRTETAWLATLVIIFMVIYPAVFLRHPEWARGQHWGWFFFSILLGTILMYEFGTALLSIGRSMSINLSSDAKRLGYIVFAVSLVLVIPSYYGGGPNATLAYQDDVARLAFVLDNLLIYLWVGAILWLLYQDGWNDLSLQPDTRWIGVLAAASILFNVTARWFSIPATFLMGWLALTWLTSNPRWEKQGRQSLDEIFAVVLKKRSEMLKNISLLNTAERTLGLLQKKKRQELAAGPADFKSAKEAIQTHLDAITELRTTNVEGVDVDLKNTALAFGRYEKAWQNGLYGAGWASLFALPWLAAYFISFMQGTNFGRAYGLSFLMEILSIVTFWIGIGFFMGYFFPYLRGESGLQKGLNLALAIILPTLPLHIIHYQTFESWQGFFLWAAQVFVECALLGLLAFDYATVRQSGHSWESLLEIHGLLSIGIWVSGVLATLAGAVATLISSPEKFLDLLNRGLQIILPVLPQLDKIIN